MPNPLSRLLASAQLDDGTVASIARSPRARTVLPAIHEVVGAVEGDAYLLSFKVPGSLALLAVRLNEGAAPAVRVVTANAREWERPVLDEVLAWTFGALGPGRWHICLHHRAAKGGSNLPALGHNKLVALVEATGLDKDALEAAVFAFA